ncbi:hypothetical protein BRC85_00225 [Halobacteriales archaeon QS_1_69_70]|nr:MAG: hypothetical protein BRC85_00225 [Halobacteriales archaeon QS_1_69_70]
MRQGYSRPTYGTPTESRIEGLNYITPFVWGTSESNGITFASDINQGVHAVIQDDIPVGGAAPVAGVTRSDDGDVFTAGQTNRVAISLDFTDRDVLVRDRLPEGWEKIGGDGTSDGDHVTFDFSAGESVAYFAQAPDESGSSTFGPVEVSADDGKTWHALTDTTDTVVVAGQSTDLAAAGLGVGTVGALSHERDRIEERFSALTSRDD